MKHVWKKKQIHEKSKITKRNETNKTILKREKETLKIQYEIRKQHWKRKEKTEKETLKSRIKHVNRLRKEIFKNKEKGNKN